MISFESVANLYKFHGQRELEFICPNEPLSPKNNILEENIISNCFRVKLTDFPQCEYLYYIYRDVDPETWNVEIWCSSLKNDKQASILSVTRVSDEVASNLIDWLIETKFAEFISYQKGGWIKEQGRFVPYKIVSCKYEI